MKAIRKVTPISQLWFSKSTLLACLRHIAQTPILTLHNVSVASKYQDLFNHMQLKAFQPLNTALCPVSLGTEVTGYGFHHIRHQAEDSSGSEWLTVHPSSQLARLSEAEIKGDPKDLPLVECSYNETTKQPEIR